MIKEDNSIQSNIEHFNEAIRLDSNNRIAYFNRANIYQKAHLFGNAIADYSILISTYPHYS